MKLIIRNMILKNALEIVVRFISKDNRRKALQFANIVNENGKVYLYATDSLKAIQYELLEVEEMSELTSFTFDPNFTLKMLKICANDFEKIVLYTSDQGNVFMDIGDLLNVSIPAFDDNYPDLSHLFSISPTPQQGENYINVDLNVLLSALRPLKKADISTIKIMDIGGFKYKISAGGHTEISIIVVRAREFE